MKTKRLITELCCAIVLVAYGNSQEPRAGGESFRAESLPQDIWIEGETELLLMRIEGDTIYYTDPQDTSVSFKIIWDTMHMYGNNTAAYKIDRQTEYSSWFHSPMDKIVKLHKSENPEDIPAPESKEVGVIPITEVMKKDNVVVYKGIRCRGYVYIDPLKMKVIRTSYSGDGISADNVYYNNVIHICTYEDRQMLYGKDITKGVLAGISPTETLNQMIFADMNFVGVNNKDHLLYASPSPRDS